MKHRGLLLSLLYTIENRSVATTMEAPTLTTQYVATASIVAHAIIKLTVPYFFQITLLCLERVLVVQMS